MYICKECKKNYSKWQGKCDSCGTWGSLEESSIPVNKDYSGSKTRRRRSASDHFDQIIGTNLSNLTLENTNYFDIKSGIDEFDNAIGGRIVAGQVILLGGTPGIGKSTLSSQLTESFSIQGLKVVYICGEESPMQIKKRIDRLGLKHANVIYITETNIDNIEHFVEKNLNDIDIIFIDSIQTIFTKELNSTAGSIAQISECTTRIVNLAKAHNKATFIIGHVTKTGDIAGPKILEHMVDTVLYFEGEKRFELRMLRVEKNRFGPTDEVGIFKMSVRGLVQVKDTKELFDSTQEDIAGSVYSMVLEGNRPIALEVQALVTKTYFSQPRRTVNGFDFNKLNILIAIIEKILNISMWEYDIYVNITGGIKTSDAGIDLAIIKAILSSLKNTPVSRRSIYFAEVGLTGQLRKVWLEDKRTKEAKRIGFENIFNSQNTNLKNPVNL